jgi:hypothetical protein
VALAAAAAFAVIVAPPASAATPSAPAAAAATLRALVGAANVHDATAADACGPPAPGHVACMAQIIVSSRSGRALAATPTRRPRSDQVRASPLLGPIAPASAFTVEPAGEPVATSAPSAGTPLYLQQAYDLTALAASAGSGRVIAIVDAYNDPTAASDLAYYRTSFGLPPCTVGSGCLSIVGQTGTSTLPSATNTGWGEEESLDLDAVSALCPNCHILLVEANSAGTSDLETAEQAALASGATLISNSWGGQQAPGYAASDFSRAGVAVLAATGDWRYNSDDELPGWPASLASVDAIGGTTLTASTTPRGFTETGWADTTSGCADQAKPVYQTDTGCAGRAYGDISADADPASGISGYDSAIGGWAVFGGTSLATPLTAAYYALIGGSAGEGNAAWDYAQGDLLNDPLSGNNSNGAACTPSYICNAGVGYDGPTGMGSISGDVVSGAPGIGGPDTANGYVAGQTSTTATIDAGIYANGEDTSYHIEYGPTTSYGQSTAPIDAGSAATIASVTTTLTGLTPGVGYHYRLVATNVSGTTYGYDESFAGLTGSAPTVTITSAPASSSTATSGEVDYSESGSVNTTACTLDGDATPCSATTATFTGLASGAHSFVVTVTGSGGSDSASADFSVLPPAPTVTITSAPASSSTATSGEVDYSESGSVSSTSCTLDGTALPCSSSVALLAGLSVGAHSFTVTAAGPGGSDADTASFTVTAPAIAPVTQTAGTGAADPGSPSPEPTDPGTGASDTPVTKAAGGSEAPIWTQLRLLPSVVVGCASPGSDCERATLRFVLRVNARVTLTLSRVVGGKAQQALGEITVAEQAGNDSLALGRRFAGRVLAPGVYDLVAVATAVGENSARASSKQLSGGFHALLHVR